MNRPLLAAVLLFIHVALVSAQSESSPARLSVYVPDTLPETTFGSPVFVPIAVANETDTELAGATLEGSITMRLTISSGDTYSIVSYDSGMRSTTIMYAPGRIDSTVLLADIWTPEIASAILKTGVCKLTFHFDEYENVRYLPASTVVTVRFHGSEFLPQAHEMIKAKALSHSVGNREGGYGFTIGSMQPLSPFTDFLTPLSWRSKTSALTSIGGTDDEYRNAEKLIRQGSSLDRFVKVSRIIRSLRETRSEKAWRTSIEELEPILADSHGPERCFYLSAISAARTAGYLPTDSQRNDRDKFLKKTFPTHASFFIGEGSTTHVSYRPVSR